VVVAARTYGKSQSADDESAEYDGSDVEEPEEKPEVIPGTTIFTLNRLNFPVLSSLLGDIYQLKEWDLQAMLRELITHFGKNRKVDWQHSNGKKARAVIIPQVKDKASFMREAWKDRWLESILEHLTGSSENLEIENAAEWLITYLGKKYDTSFVLALEALGLPLVQRMDEASTEAMWCDANINVVQQRILRKHLKFHFGKRIFLPQTQLKVNREIYQVETMYGSYKYYKGGDRTQKPEKCPYWHRDPSAIVKNELCKLIDYSDVNDNSASSAKLSSLNNSICTLVSGADQGQGAW